MVILFYDAVITNKWVYWYLKTIIGSVDIYYDLENRLKHVMNIGGLEYSDMHVSAFVVLCIVVLISLSN